MSSGLPVVYRAAVPSDADGVAHLHAESWRSHYRGAYSDAYLDTDVWDERRDVWTARLSHPIDSARTLVAEDSTGAVVGFSHVLLDEDDQFGSFLDNLHVTTRRRGSGIGTELLRMTAGLVAEHGHGGLYLWVLMQNTGARAFYRSRGGTPGAQAPAAAPGGVADRLVDSPTLLRITWPDPQALIG